MKKRIIAVALSTALAGPAWGAGIPTFDGVSAANAVRQLAEIGKQVQLAQQQLAQVQATYRAVTGNRGYGALLSNPMLRQALPPDLQSLYYTASSRNYAGLSGPLERILRSEQLATNVPDAQRAILAREGHVRATNKAVAELAYTAAQRRLAELDRLQAEIGRTQDQKGIQELQARIAIEQAAIQNEQMKLSLVQQMQSSELALAQSQREQLVARMFDPSVKASPSIR